ncbi:hypothetical protein ACFQS6_08885 [Xanthomonas populi]
MNTTTWSDLRTDLSLPFRASIAAGAPVKRLLILTHGVGATKPTWRHLERRWPPIRASSWPVAP